MGSVERLSPRPMTKITRDLSWRELLMMTRFLCRYLQISQISADICRYLQISADISIRQVRTIFSRHNLPCNPYHTTPIVVVVLTSPCLIVIIVARLSTATLPLHLHPTLHHDSVVEVQPFIEGIDHQHQEWHGSIHEKIGPVRLSVRWQHQICHTYSAPAPSLVCPVFAGIRGPAKSHGRGGSGQREMGANEGSVVCC